MAAVSRSALTFFLLALLNGGSRSTDQSTSCCSHPMTDHGCADFDRWCTFSENDSVLQCRNVTRFDCPRACAHSIKVVRIIGGKFGSMSNASFLFCQLTSLSIRHSDLTHVDTVPSTSTLEDLDISNNSRLTRISNSAWELLNKTNLISLTLSNNRLSSIEAGFQTLKLMSNRTLKSLDISGNEWRCASNFSPILDIQHIVRNGDQLKCSMMERKSWTLTSFSIIPRETIRKIVSSECSELLPNCSCQVNAGDSEVSSYSVLIDCAYKKLLSLPHKLPKNTTELDVTGNLLSSIDQVANIRLKTLIADSNEIHSIRNLSGSPFMRHFSRLSLRNNRIHPKEIPLNEIAKTIDDFHHKFLYLYNNSWECNCELATTVRDWLFKNRHIVNDSSMLLCTKAGKKIPVLHLLPQAACPKRNEKEGEMLYYIIFVESFLLLSLFLKFAHDWWRYVHHDELPWIATKLP